MAVERNTEQELLERGEEYFFNGEHGKAAECFLEILELNPNHTEAYQYCGSCFYLLGDYNAALKKKIQYPETSLIRSKIIV